MFEHRILSRFIDHIDLRVRDLAAARPFYDAFMAALGLGSITSGEDSGDWIGYAYEEDSTPFFGLIVEPGHVGDRSRIAFAADSKEEVDRIGAAVSAAGAVNVEGPAFCPEYHPKYYAVFFEDQDGNRLEVCCHTVEPG